MIMAKINTGTALRFMSYLLYEAGEALQRAGDVLGDAGDLYEAKAPRAKARAKETMERVTGDAWTAASVLSGVMACSVALCYRGAAYITRGTAALVSVCKRRAPAILDGIRGEILQASSLICRAGQRARQSMAGAWAFRAAVVAEERGAAIA